MFVGVPFHCVCFSFGDDGVVIHVQTYVEGAQQTFTHVGSASHPTRALREMPQVVFKALLFCVKPSIFSAHLVPRSKFQRRKLRPAVALGRKHLVPPRSELPRR